MHTVLPLVATFWAWEAACEPTFERVIRFSGYTATTPGRPRLFEHRFTSGIPQAGGENARINLWLVAGQPPASGAPIEVIVKRLNYELE